MIMTGYWRNVWVKWNVKRHRITMVESVIMVSNMTIIGKYRCESEYADRIIKPEVPVCVSRPYENR